MAPEEVQTVTVELTLAMASALETFLPRFADMIQGEATAELRPMGTLENLAHDALSWTFLSLQDDLKRANKQEIRKQINHFHEGYVKELDKQAKEN